MLFYLARVLNYFYVGFFHLQTVSQYGVGGFMQNTLPQADKTFVWHPPPCPQCFSSCILPVQCSPEQKVFFKYHTTKVVMRFLSKIKLEKWGYGRFDRNTDAWRLLTFLSLFKYSYLYLSLKRSTVGRVTYSWWSSRNTCSFEVCRSCYNLQVL